MAPKLASLLEFGGTYSGAYMLRRAIFLPWELPKIMDPEMAAEGLAALAPHANDRRRAGSLPTPTLAKSECWKLRFTCETNCCEMRTGRAWHIRLRFVFRLSTLNCCGNRCIYADGRTVSKTVSWPSHLLKAFPHAYFIVKRRVLMFRSEDGCWDGHD